MSVPRFDLGPHQMTPSSEGAYVRYEDYAKLEKALEQACEMTGLKLIKRLLPDQEDTPEVIAAKEPIPPNGWQTESELAIELSRRVWKARWATMPTRTVINVGDEDEYYDYPCDATPELAAYLREREDKR